MLEDWVNCGMTDPVTPVFSLENDDHKKFLEMLDHAERLGVKMILQISEIFLDFALEDRYPATVAAVVKEFGSHPAAGGYYVGEEPSAAISENYKKGIKIIRDADPDARIYINMGSIERTERCLLSITGETLDEWCSDIAKGSGGDIIG